MSALRAQLKVVFEKWDHDKAEVISAVDLKLLLRKLLPSFSELDLAMLVDKADANNDGRVDYKEWIDFMMENGPLDFPPDVKAIFPILETPAGPDPMAPNEKLKLLLTSAGMMPDSTSELLSRYQQLASTTPGRGVLFLMDAKLKTLQWQEHGNADPAKHNDQKFVAYKREPDVPGGTPVMADGNVVMKTQAELLPIGYAGVEYALRQNHHYSNGHLDVLAAGGPGEEVPVYLSYLCYDGDVDANGKAEAHILVAKGHYKDGEFTMLRADGSGAFTNSDYEAAPDYSQGGSASFGRTSDTDFAAIVDSVKTIWSCGGVTWSTVMNLQPYFVNDGEVLHDQPNVYGKSVLDATKEGSVVYIGQSAGSVALSYSIGPLTTDPTDFKLETEDGVLEEMNLDFELGKKMLHPGLGDYIGIPYRLLFRPHLKFNVSRCSYEGRAVAVDKVKEEVGDMASHNIYCVCMADYNFKTGQGDVLEISGGKVCYHVGYCDDEQELSEEAKAKLKEAGQQWKWVHEAGTIRKQPLGNPPEGWSFEWKPEDGEVHAAGPKAVRPFHIYASSHGLLREHPCPAGSAA